MKPNENYLSNEKNERLYDIAKVLRSKNAGPLFITLDIIFEDKNSYIRVKESGLINNSYISRQYNVEEKDVIIIDDVLFTGRTVRSAMDGIMNFGRPRKIELLVLIDRNYSRDVPIEPTYCGIKINTITSDRIEVNLAEQGFDNDNIWIINK